MPNAPRTPVRRFRVHDDVWQAAHERAVAEGTTVSAVLVAALEAYGDTPTPAQPRAPRGSRTPKAVA